jgi:regulatory protein
MAENNLFKSSLQRAMAICAGGEHSGGDIRRKLSSWGISGKDADEILQILVKENFINDKRYASAYISDKLRYNKWGKIKISSQLKLKGISDEIIKSSMNEIDEQRYQEMIKEVISSYRRRAKAKNQYDLKGKLMRFGLSRGYENHLLYDIINDLE